MLVIVCDIIVEFYGRVGNSFKFKDEFKGYDKIVISIDIVFNLGCIVICF